MLAGEAYDRIKPGTVNGALSSGRRAADALLAGWTRAPGGRTPGRSAAVVGAGVSGLAAAAALHRAGIRVVVFEARARIGGRIHTDRSLGFPVELGASWVHGLSKNPLVPMLHASGRSLLPTDYDDLAVFDLGGRPVSSDAVGAAQDKVWSSVSKAQNQGTESSSLAQGLTAVGFPSDPLHAWALCTELEQDYADDASHLSLWHFDDDAELVGGDAMVVGGYDGIPELLARRLDVRRSNPVRAIRPSGRRVEVVAPSGPLQFDAVVVTPPVSLLQSDAIDIDWSGFGAGRQRDAVRGFGMGDLEKAIVMFDRRFWPSNQIVGIVGYRGGTFASGYDLSRLYRRPAMVFFSAGDQSRTLPAAPDQVLAMLSSVLPSIARPT